MPHAHEREANLLGALGLALADAEQRAAARALGDATPSLAAALVTVANFAPRAGLPVLATTLGLSHSGAVRLADRLVERGLVRRLADADDGRAVHLRLTPAGRRALRRVRAAREAELERWLDPLDAAERAQLTALGERLLEAHVDARSRALVVCRLCDPDVCGHPETCPVTHGADRGEAAR